MRVDDDTDEEGQGVDRADDEAFLAFVQHSSERLLRLGWMLTGDRSSAEDLVQEALTRVYVAWPRIDAGGRHAYARRVLANLHVDGHRKRRLEVVEEPPEVGVPDRSEAIATSAELANALATLPTRERQCVVLRHHADLSEADVAAVLGTSVGTVKSSTSRGLARLRSLLVPEGGSHV